jgi:hypothetical protein
LYESPEQLTSEEYQEKLRRGQEQLLESSAICTKVCEWLASTRRAKAINRHRTSYGLKHTAELQIGEYVSNGVFIAAAIHCGFSYRVDGDSPYMMFAMSERSLNLRAHSVSGPSAGITGTIDRLDQATSRFRR